YAGAVVDRCFKTAVSLFSWLSCVGGVVGTKLAARLFTLLVIAAGAFTLPQFLLQFTNRRRMIVAGLLAWPMVHNWFVSSGMLDFALGVPLSLLVLVAVDRRRKAPTWKNALAIAG